MRTLNATVTAATSGPVFRPAYLVQIDFSTTIRLCTKEDVVWGGFTWYRGGCQVGQISTGQGGGQELSITLANNHNAYSVIILSEISSGRRVRVWKLFGSAPYDVGAAVLMFDGVIEDVPELGDQVTINCSTLNAKTVLVPNVTIGLPFFNFLPRTGQVIYWGTDTYELQPR